MKGKIELCGMKFFARHGCLEEERINGNEFVVDLSCRCNLKKACMSDSLEDTVDYGLIYKAVASQMERPSNLLENVAWRILRSVKQACPALEDISVSVSKKNPPVGGECEWSRISITE